MATRLNPYISFNNNAREAMEYYKDVFGGELTMSTFGEFGHADDAAKNNIMHSQLQTPQGYTIMGADNPPGENEVQVGNNISVSLSGDDDSLRDHFEKLADGGNVAVKLEKQMWGDEFGMVVDRFGITWMVNITGAQNR